MRTRLSKCRRKLRFTFAEDALLAAERFGLPLIPYRCDRCAEYHLTSRRKGKPTAAPSHNRS